MTLNHAPQTFEEWHSTYGGSIDLTAMKLAFAAGVASQQARVDRAFAEVAGHIDLIVSLEAQLAEAKAEIERLILQRAQAWEKGYAERLTRYEAVVEAARGLDRTTWPASTEGLSEWVPKLHAALDALEGK